MKAILKYFLYIFIFLGLISCNENKGEQDVKSIAVAGDKNLNENEYKQFNFMGSGANDSAFISKKLIEDWAQDELFYQEAKEKLMPEDLNVDAEVEKYRQELINYKYEIRLIENNLDTSISKQEIQAYYDANRDNFILKDNIVKVNYFKVPVKSKALAKMKAAVVSQNPKEKENLKALCLQYADNYFINDSTWLLLEDIKKEIPQLRELPEYNFYAGRYFEYTDSLNYYYLKIKEIKIKNGLSPINFEMGNIKNILLNGRKMKLIRQYKQQILEKAKSEGKFKVN
ncbi:MAG: hypothetical protein KA163_10520 [Bacteroidia bacterium]|nr:hypothetical protein [Bacteroidia bacterium]